MSTRISTEDRLLRLLAAIPWIAEEEGPTVTEVCERFGYNEDELASDLELLFVCGVYPFTPDALMETEIADGRVWVRYADYFARPLRLTPAEGLAVLGAGKAMLSSTDSSESSPLFRALSKLAASMGIDLEQSIDVELSVPPPEVLDVLRGACENHTFVDLSYYSYGRDVWSDRTIAPVSIRMMAGEWYVQGFDKGTENEKLFRVDRMQNVKPTSETFEPPKGWIEPRVFRPTGKEAEVTIELDSSKKWVLDYYPFEDSQTLKNGNVRVRMRIAGEAFLERLLLRLGSDTPVEGADGVARAAANRILARYS